VLALHPDRMAAGFGIRRIVEDKDPVRLGQGLRHGRPVFPRHGCLVPVALVDELLESLLGVGHRAQRRWQAHPARERFNGFAFPLQKKAAQVNLAPEGLTRAIKMGTKPFGVRLQALEHDGPKPRRESAIHATAVRTHQNRVASIKNLTE
jgi:hypothetical protein